MKKNERAKFLKKRYMKRMKMYKYKLRLSDMKPTLKKSQKSRSKDLRQHKTYVPFDSAEKDRKIPGNHGVPWEKPTSKFRLHFY